MRRAVGSPSPEPVWKPEKYTSNTRSRSAAAIPHPSSRISNTSRSPSGRAVTDTVPPRSVASCALSSRLSSACLNSAGSTAAVAGATSTSSPMPSSWKPGPTNSASSSTSGAIAVAFFSNRFIPA